MIPAAAARTCSRVPAGLVRVASLVAAAALTTTALTYPTAAASPPGRTPGRPAAAEDTGTAPLAVSIESLTPSTVPQRGEVTVTGEITNRSESTWTDLRVYMLASSTPMTTSAELEEANATDETLEVGARLTDEGLYDEVDELEPGESTGYVLSVPQRELRMREPGVYWLGVHVLGTNEDGRIEGADGRARTFIASMPPRGPQTTLSLVLPLRGEVRRTPEGRLPDVAAWNRRLGDDGRLSRLVELVETSPDVPLTWVVDPAVLGAVLSVAEGNPAFDLTPTDEAAEEDGGESPSPASPGAEESSSESASPGTESQGPSSQDEGAGTDEADPEAEQAAGWLSAYTELVSGQTVLALPYGDADVATLLRGGFDDLLDRADQLSETSLEGLGLSGAPVVAPSSGLLPDAALEKLSPETSLLLSERAVATDATTARLAQGTEAVLTSDVARVGGPSPTPPYDALALRQRILAEASVQALATPDQPLVVSLPDLWDPGSDWSTSLFFGGLDVPWIRTVDLPIARAIGEAEEYDGPLAYSRVSRRRELPAANVLATQELDAAGSVLAELLTRNDTIDEQVGQAAMLGSSTNVRTRPRRALVRTRRTSATVHRSLRRVHVESTPLVTLSSESGKFHVTVVNGLDEPVTVGIDVDTGTEALEIPAPDLVSLGAGQRASVRLAVRSTGTGVHSVRISPTTRDGRPIGESTRIKVRSSQVGLVIWFVMGTGAVVFFAAIGARVLRRMRARRRQADDTKQEDAAA